MPVSALFVERKFKRFLQFLGFFLETGEAAAKVNGILAENGAGAIAFGANTWHFYPAWEHLLGAKSLCTSGWPFSSHGGKRRVVYDADALPQSAALMDRLLVYQVPVILSDERLVEMLAAIKKAGLIICFSR